MVRSWEDWDSPDERPTTAPARPLADLLAEMAQRKQWRRRLEAARIHQVWEEVAGPQLARHVAPVRLAGGVLVVRASSAAWATQVQYLAGELAQRANTVLGPDQVRQVRVQTANPAAGGNSP